MASTRLIRQPRELGKLGWCQPWSQRGGSQGETEPAACLAPQPSPTQSHPCRRRGRAGTWEKRQGCSCLEAEKGAETTWGQGGGCQLWGQGSSLRNQELNTPGWTGSALWVCISPEKYLWGPRGPCICLQGQLLRHYFTERLLCPSHLLSILRDS